MQAIAVLGILLAIPLALLGISQLDVFTQATSSQTGAIRSIITNTTLLWITVVGLMAVTFLIAVLVWVISNR